LKLLISFPLYNIRDILNRVYNMSRFLNGVPDFIYKNSRFFLYLSNELEMDRIKMETRQRAADAQGLSDQRMRMNAEMQRRRNAAYRRR